jgi:hypothetical protein
LLSMPLVYHFRSELCTDQPMQLVASTVLRAGLEPARLAAMDFKSTASADSAT